MRRFHLMRRVMLEGSLSLAWEVVMQYAQTIRRHSWSYLSNQHDPDLESVLRIALLLRLLKYKISACRRG